MTEAVGTETSSLVSGGGSRVIGLVAAVVTPTTLITALAYYFGYRLERAFAGFFGIDISALNFTTTDYVLRSVDALFVPAVVVLLVAFGFFFLHALVGDLSSRVDLAPIAAVTGLCALILGIALLAGEPLVHSHGYLQALGPAVGVSLLLCALARKRSVSRQALSAAVFVGVGVVLCDADADRQAKPRGTRWTTRSSSSRTTTRCECSSRAVRTMRPTVESTAKGQIGFTC